MNVDILFNIDNLRKEQKDLEKRIERIENKSKTVISDSVQASSTTYPYTKYSVKITGVEYPKHNNLKYKYKKMLKDKVYKLGKSIIELEYQLNNIQDAEIKEIIRLKWVDNLSWLQIMHRQNYSSESAARMKLERYFKKNKKNSKCAKCADIKS